MFVSQSVILVLFVHKSVYNFKSIDYTPRIMIYEQWKKKTKKKQKQPNNYVTCTWQLPRIYLSTTKLHSVDAQ